MLRQEVEEKAQIISRNERKENLENTRVEIDVFEAAESGFAKLEYEAYCRRLYAR